MVRIVGVPVSTRDKSSHQLVCAPHQASPGLGQHCWKRCLRGRDTAFRRAVPPCQVKLEISRGLSVIQLHPELLHPVPGVLSLRVFSWHYLGKRVETPFALNVDRHESAAKMESLHSPRVSLKRRSPALLDTSFQFLVAVAWERSCNSSQQNPEGWSPVTSSSGGSPP